MAPSSSLLARPWVAWLPIGGVVTFVALYFYAASLYPGGTHTDHGTIGYSHFSNYWCDLLRAVSHSGATNCARPFAVLATVILPLSVIPFWFQVPVLFDNGSSLGRLVQVLGSAAMVFCALIFTTKHDAAINVAAILGLVAFGVTALRLKLQKPRTLAGIGIVAMVSGMANYLMWQFRVFLWAMPTVQKIAFAAFLLWFVLGSRAIHRRLSC